jgi:hypothetical protein
MIIAVTHEDTLKPALKSINLSIHRHYYEDNLLFCMNLAIAGAEGGALEG